MSSSPETCCPTCGTVVKAPRPGKGDILVLRLGHPITPEALQGFASMLHGEGLECVVMTIQDDSDLYCLNEAAMGELGWRKVSR